MNENTNRFVGTNWDEPEVRCKSHGSSRRDIERKVITKGIKEIPCDGLIEKITSLIRSGYEVRLGDAIRVYPCMDADFKNMYPAAATMNPFRGILSDKKAKVVHCGEVVDGEELAAKARKRNEKFNKRRIEVTPDLMVTCPQCGINFRVGRSLAQMR